MNLQSTVSTVHGARPRQFALAPAPTTLHIAAIRIGLALTIVASLLAAAIRAHA